MATRPIPTYVVTYTSDRAHHLGDEFYIVKILAHSAEDAYTIIRNVEEHFGATVVTLEEEIPKQKRRSKTNSDRRKKNTS